MFKRIRLVLQREYLSRVKKRSFLIMTFLTPILVALFYGVVFYIILHPHRSDKDKQIAVFDKSGYFSNKLNNGDHINFTYINSENVKINFDEMGFDGCLILNWPDSSKKFQAEILTKESLSIAEQGYIERTIEEIIYTENLKELNVNQESLKNAHVRVSLNSKKMEHGIAKESSSGVTTGIGIATSVLIYFFIFIYGSQVMRGVMEEKTNRIVEVIISSVKPFELMMGKILGISLVALTQMALWVILSTIATGVVGNLMGTSMQSGGQAQQLFQAAPQGGSELDFLKIFASLNLGLLGFSFIFYFIFGYLFYAALFAAIGSAVDSETELQQFTLPVTLPLVFSFILTISLIQSDPNGSTLFWISMLPFSSPVAMMARIPFLEAENYWQLGLSMFVLVLSFIGTVWLAARIYRTGILMYGKKASWKEIYKWLFYKG